MPYRFKHIIVFFLLFYSLTSYGSDDHNAAKRFVESGDILPLETILSKARAIQPGKVLEVEFETENGRKIYEIEILSTEGKVLELKMDAQTGMHISTKKED